MSDPDWFEEQADKQYGREVLRAHGLDYSEAVPECLVDCRSCGGIGYTQRTIHVYELGCGFSHPDVQEIHCEACGGNGWFLTEIEGDDNGRRR